MDSSRELDQRREAAKDPYGAASLTHDDEILAAVVDRRARQLEEIERALEDIEAGCYGTCRDCSGAPGRGPARREAVPAPPPRTGEEPMRRGVRVFAALLVILSLAAGCRAMTGKTAGRTIDDATITASVKSKLVAEKAANLTRVDVDTNNGTVYLNGTVETPEQKARAEQLAWQAQGVKSVVNNLQLQKR